MLRFATLLVLALILSASAVLGYLWANDLTNSVYGYRSPLTVMPLPTEQHNNRIVSQVVLVIVDGLRYDVSFEMPFLNGMRQKSSHARLIHRPFTSAPAAWTTILSGAWPEISDAPAFDVEPALMRPIAVDTLLASCNRAGQNAGVAASALWQGLLPPDSLYLRYFAPSGAANRDQSTVKRAVSFLQEFSPCLLVVHLDELDAVAHRSGAASDEYRLAALTCDGLLQEIAEALDLTKSALFIASSFGHLDQGGRGGHEPVLLTTPLLASGAGILTGDRSSIDAADIAPTIAVLLGVPVPSAAQGQVRLDMIRLPVEDKAEALVGLAAQRVQLARVYFQNLRLGAVSETALGDLTVAISSLQVRNYASAAELAALSVEQTDRHMAFIRDSRWRETAQRYGAIVAAAAVLLLIALWRARSPTTLCVLLASLGSAVLYHVLYLREGQVYSFSAVPAGGLTTTVSASVERTAVVLACGLAVVLLTGWRERSAYTMAVRTQMYALLQLWIVGLAAGLCAISTGPRLSWFIPDLRLVFVLLTLIVQGTLLALFAVVLPLPLVVLHQVMVRTRDIVHRWRK